MKKEFHLPANWVESHKVISGPLRDWVKAMNLAGHHLVATVGPKSRSNDANAKYHAMVAEIAAQVPVGGKLRDAETMKRLLVDQFKADTLHDFADEWHRFGNIEMAPSLDGQRIVVLGVQTRKFTRKLAGAFIEWLYAWGADAGVAFREATIDPETGEIVTVTRAPRRLEAA